MDWLKSVYVDGDINGELVSNPFTPLAGELIIYDPDSVYKYRRFKFGDGTTNVVDLPFSAETTAGLGLTVTAQEKGQHIDFDNEVAFIFDGGDAMTGLTGYTVENNGGGETIHLNPVESTFIEEENAGGLAAVII
jgi:hypothetical protein